MIVLGLLSPFTPAADAKPWEWEGVDRVVVLGDVHGAFDKMVSLLRGTGMVDSELSWSGGNDHLVFVGDLVDRGPDDRKVLDLARRLQAEAPVAGGYVHILLGNHEVMNMVADLRYVSDGGYAAFAEDESKRDRSRALQRFRNTVFGPNASLTEARKVFEEEFPPGYFARLRAFWFDGEYGSWLLQMPAIIEINGIAFVHGGLTEEVASLGLEEINRAVHEDIRAWMQDARELYQIESLPPSYKDVMRVAKTYDDKPEDSSKTATVARSVVRHHRSLPFSPGGPLWYRGNSLENERIERTRIQRSLSALDARALVIAHTPTGTGRITSRFDAQVFRVDVGMAYGRKPLALVIEGDRFRVFDPATSEYIDPPAEVPEGEGWSRILEQLPEAQLEAFMRETEASNCRLLQKGLRHAEVCELDGETMQLRIVFQDVDEQSGSVAEEPSNIPRSYRNEIASYHLDRILGLGMVPVTVAKTIDQRPGSAQLFLESAVDLPLIEIYEQFDLRDALEDQISEARIFSALVAVQERNDAGKMILPQEGRIAIADNTKAFGTAVELDPQWFEASCGPLRADLAHALRSLSQESLQQLIGTYLSPAQIEALLGRRDSILRRCSDP
ncbi:MAG: metallophosphoesterase [Acidobacteriota bacterium]